MHSPLDTAAIIHLEALCDEVLFRSTDEEEESNSKKALKYGVGAAAAGAAGYGAKVGIGRIQSNYGGPGVPFKDSAKAAAGDLAKRAAKTKVGAAAATGWKRSAGQSVIKRVGRAVRGGFKSMFEEGMSAKDKLVALDAMLTKEGK